MRRYEFCKDFSSKINPYFESRCGEGIEGDLDILHSPVELFGKAITSLILADASPRHEMKN